MLALYLSVFVLLVVFRRLPALIVAAPTQKEPPFLVTQLVVLAVRRAGKGRGKETPRGVGRHGWMSRSDRGALGRATAVPEQAANANTRL